MALSTTSISSKPPDHTKTEINLTDSSFFKVPNQELPSPERVAAFGKRYIAMFPELQLAVKYGKHVSVDEAMTMWTIREHFGDLIPVPELFGWRVLDDKVFIYMELIHGVTLEDRWKDLTESDKASTCEQIRDMISSLRELRHNGEDVFIGSVIRGPLLDRVFYERPRAGPFNTLEEFYCWLEWLPQRFLQPSQRFTDPYLECMPADSPIKFTHADIHRTNIMVSASGPPCVLAMIDWGQSGWYPDWWEYFKMCYTMDWEDEWRKYWTPKMIEARGDEAYLMAEYSMTIGAV